MKGLRITSKYWVTSFVGGVEGLFGQWRTKREFQTAVHSMVNTYTSPSKSDRFHGLGGQQFKAYARTGLGSESINPNKPGDDLFITV